MPSYIQGLATCSDLIQWRNRLRLTVPVAQQARLVQAAPIVPASSLMFLYRFDPTTDPKPIDMVTKRLMDHYDTLLLFPHLNFSTTRQGTYNYPVEVMPGVFQYIQRPSVNRNPVQVVCSCRDYYFSWDYFNGLIYARTGPAFQPYTRTDGLANGTPAYVDRFGTYHPQPNPLGVPGICKHLVKSIEDLIRQRFLVQ